MGTAPSLGRVLKAALLAALAAGLVTAAFHTVATEPVIDAAIALEEAAADAHEAPSDPVVSRPAQKAGLVLGFGLYGLALGLLFTVAYRLGRSLVPVDREPTKAAWLAALGYASLGVLPMLKYPANPPGVGDPATIEYRQALYLALLAAGLLLAAAALVAARATGGPGWRRLAAGAAVLVLGGVSLYLLLPANPDEVAMPLDLVQQFRVLSVAGVTVFWAVFGAGFAWLLGRGAGMAGARAG